MPKDNWMRAIKKGSGDGGGNDYQEKVYEGYAAGGIALIVECLTDNLNRTVSNIRFAFSKHGGSLGTEGSVGWMFQRKGLISLSKNAVSDLEQLFEAALDAGAEDIEELDDEIEIICSMEGFPAVREKIESLGLNPSMCELTRLADNMVDISGDQIAALEKFVDALEDDEDVQNVYHNADF
jgi:YebC/PmpR family DNA-binding regulatory protein